MNSLIGTNIPIRDATLKVTGELLYVDDMKLPGMLYAKVLFSPKPHARITRIDMSKAEALEGVHAVVCYQNAPDVLFNSCGEEIDGAKTERIFDRTVRFIGDKVAAVAADTLKLAEQAVKLIEVDYEELPYYLTPKEALQAKYPIHEGGNVIEEVVQAAGDLESGFTKADVIYEDSYTMPAVHHAAIETHTSIAQYQADGVLTIYSPSQDVFGQRMNLSRIFGIPMSKVRIMNPGIGGGFGGKIDLVTEQVTTLLAIATGHPVKLTYNRREEISASRTRHGMEIRVKTGVTRKGTIVAQEIEALVNAGAYAGATMSIVWAMCSKFFKNHKTPNLKFRGIPVYTNTPIAGAMRGFGSPQLFFAQQCQLNQIAKDLGMDIIALQLKNLVEPYDVDARNGLSHGNARPLDCVKKGMELFKWEKKSRESKELPNSHIRKGIGMAVADHGNGVFGVRPDTTGIIIKMNEDGTAILSTGVCDMGNGSVTTQIQIVAEILGLKMEEIGCVQADTHGTLWDLGNYSSRGTFVSCQAAGKVAKQVKRELQKEAALLLCSKKANIILENGLAFDKNNLQKCASLEEVVKYAKSNSQRDICCADTFASSANAISYGAHFAEVEVNIDTGSVKVVEYVAVHDVGKALNPMSVEGQIEGAIQMGIGYALCEKIQIAESGKVQNATFKQYHLLNALEMPRIQIALIEEGEKSGPFGAKSIGECAVVPVAPAIANAVSNAIDRSIKDIPIS